MKKVLASVSIFLLFFVLTACSEISDIDDILNSDDESTIIGDEPSNIVENDQVKTEEDYESGESNRNQNLD